MKAIIGTAILGLTASAALGQFFIEPSTMPLVDSPANGTWSGDLVNKPIYTDRIYQEIGSLGLADASGSARSVTFAPIDFSQEPPPNGFLARLIFTTWEDSSFLFNVYDSTGGSSASAPITASTDGAWEGVSFFPSSFTGSANLEDIVQWGISGLGGSSAFHAAVSDPPPAPIPEPGTTAAVVGGLLAAFAAWKRRK